MPYVRQRGNQVLIVHGEREPRTGKVEQRILFTLYSRAEAREAVGPGARSFESLLGDAQPELRFDWKRIRREITRLTPALPERYDYDEARRRGRFQKALHGFARELMLVDTQSLVSSALLVKENRVELEYLASLVTFRLRLCEQEENEWNQDNAFHWRFSIRNRELPPEIEEELADLWERGELDRADALFRLAVACFPGYAEGHNYLGLIALERDRLEEAVTLFEKTIELGRRSFPRRIARSRYWTDHATRPYMRGLRNLAMAFSRAGRWAEALSVCDRLEEECGDRDVAMMNRASVWLNTGRYAEAAGAARTLLDLGAEMGFVVGFALYETGQPRAALASFLYAALNAPRAARMLAGRGTGRSGTAPEARDHNTGVDLLRALHAYLAGPGRPARRFLARTLAEPGLARLLAEQAELERRNDEEVKKRVPPPTETFRELSERRRLSFAERTAPAIGDALGLPPETPLVAIQPAPRSRRGARTIH